jgi:peptidoglycan hydrolase-like protein with peptidoglycan-binding domain
LLNVWLRSFDEEPIPLLELDGVAGGKTAGITVRFQEAHGLGADAVVGPQTWTNLIGSSILCGHRRVPR